MSDISLFEDDEGCLHLLRHRDRLMSLDLALSYAKWINEGVLLNDGFAEFMLTQDADCLLDDEPDGLLQYSKMVAEYSSHTWTAYPANMSAKCKAACGL